MPKAALDSPIVGEATPNEHYLGLRLSYSENEAESLDPIGWRFFKALLVHWVMAYFLLFPLVAILYLLGLRSEGDYRLILLVFFLVFFFLPVRVSLSEWKFMVDRQAGAAPQAFEHIAWSFQQRDTPVDQVSVKRLMLGGGASRDYLYTRLGIFRGYVSSFAFGRDLYIGWTFWWSLSTARWVLLLLQRLFQKVTLRGSDLHNILRYDNGKALREAIHGAAREGVDAASGAVSFQGSGTVGSEIPIETTGLPGQGFGTTFGR